MKKIVALFLLIILANCEPAVKSKETLMVNNGNVLEQKLNNNPFLVDVRTPEEFAQGSVKGAVNIPLDQVQNRISEFKGKKNIVTFCRSGQRSEKAISILKENGITDVSNGTNVETVEQMQTKK